MFNTLQAIVRYNQLINFAKNVLNRFLLATFDTSTLNSNAVKLQSALEL
jgi:hypothetical protein